MTSILPRLRGTGSHRADDRIAELKAEHATEMAALRDENVRHLNRQAGSDDFFAVLMHDVVTTNAAWEQEKQLRAEAEEAASQMRMERDEWRDEALALRARFGPQLAAEANANAVTVPCGYRDTSAIEDQATEPIDVRPLWEVRDAGLLGAVGEPGRPTR
ncbi:hypothetical protein [Streptomyces sp. FxanaA7]|uniref:hypothetical protein n=1 Tax=Streptomyces sp. FxanaA7 TaxID=1265492 RepID=UPI0005F0A39F|nr:hypothetical protein [Streptomyces sp. FxanaA7]